jgi:ribosome-associated toxin RatA of RatAB toxin-antitoxin module
MGKLDVSVLVPGMDARAAFDRVSCFEDYPAHADAVRRVEVLEKDATSITSSWEVNFRRGILCWTERATFHPEAGTIRFEEVEGDVDAFSGYWSVQAEGTGARVRFLVEFDVGVPTLEHILDPIAEEALYDNVVSILRGLLGEVEVETAVAESAAWRS